MVSEAEISERPPDAHIPGAAGVHALRCDTHETLCWDRCEPSDLGPLVARGGVWWFRVDDVADKPLLAAVGKAFGLHELVVDDIVNTRQRPKLEAYDGYVFITMKLLRFRRDNLSILNRQLALVLGPNYVISFHESGGEQFAAPIVERRLRAGARSEKKGVAFLVYTIIDAVVDRYSEIAEEAVEIFEEIEDRLLEATGRDSLRLLYRLKRINLSIRRAIWPLREVVGLLRDECAADFSHPLAPYLRDVQDHVLHLMDITDSLRETHGMLLDVHLSSVSNRLNEVMKFLTLIATIFIPVTFIAGVYGMNFKHMPELEWSWGYPVCLALMGLVCVGMLMFFWKKDWL